MYLFSVCQFLLVVLIPYPKNGKKKIVAKMAKTLIKNKLLDNKLYPKSFQLPLGDKVHLHLLIKEVIFLK